MMMGSIHPACGLPRKRCQNWVMSPSPHRAIICPPPDAVSRKIRTARSPPKNYRVNGKDWDVYAVGGSPSQSVAHGILEIVPRKPDLVVTGINFGENFGTDVTYSGTVGAAIEAASLGIPGLAMSQQILFESWDKYHDDDRFHRLRLLHQNILPN